MIKVRIQGEAESNVREAAEQLGLDINEYIAATLWLSGHLIKRGFLVRLPESTRGALIVQAQGNTGRSDLRFDLMSRPGFDIVVQP